MLHIKLLALFRGLAIAWDCGFRRVVCYSDSSLVVSLVKDPPSHFHAFVVLIHNIRDLLHRSWVVRVVHTLHERNACADFLAKMRARQDLDSSLFKTPYGAFVVD